jgi:hypothetical protein
VIVPISDLAGVDLDVPVLPAYEAVIDDATQWHLVLLAQPGPETQREADRQGVSDVV